MALMKVIPWFFTVILAGVCWQQQQTISTLEKENIDRHQQSNLVDAESTSQKNVSQKKTIETRSIGSKTTQPSSIKQSQLISGASHPEKPMSDDDLEAMIEERVWKRLEELEEEKRQSRVEQMNNRMQNLVDDWTDQFDWSEDTQNTMMDILTDFIHSRVEVHVLLKNKSLEREGIRPYFQQIAKERNEAIIELVGEDEFSELVEDLDPRSSKP